MKPVFVTPFLSMKALHVLLMLAFFAGATCSCKKDAASVIADARKEQQDAIKELDTAFGKLKEGNAEVVDFRLLKEALPERVQGMERVSHNGQKTGIAGLNVSTADAEYRDGDKYISITLLDSGGLGAVMAGLAAWSKVEMDKETEDGYERTTMTDGKKAYEKYNRTTMAGEIAIIAAERFLISVKGENVTEEDLSKAISKIKVNP